MANSLGNVKDETELPEQFSAAAAAFLARLPKSD